MNKNRGVHFREIKNAFMNKPFVKIIDPAKEVTLTTNASHWAIATIFSQEDDPVIIQKNKIGPGELFGYLEGGISDYV